MQAGQFRRDLFYRLQVVEIRVPSLRERRTDIVILADHFLTRFVRETGRKIRGFTPAALKKMEQYEWPGNVRELRNVVERAVALGTGPTLDSPDIWLSSLEVMRHRPSRRPTAKITSRWLSTRSKSHTFSERSIHRMEQEPGRRHPTPVARRWIARSRPQPETCRIRFRRAPIQIFDPRSTAIIAPTIHAFSRHSPPATLATHSRSDSPDPPSTNHPRPHSHFL